MGIRLFVNSNELRTGHITSTVRFQARHRLPKCTWACQHARIQIYHLLEQHNPSFPNSSRSKFENSKRRFVEPLPSSSYNSCFSNFSHRGQLQGFSQTKTSQTQKINLSCALISQQCSLQTQLFLFLFVDNLNLLKRSGSHFRKKVAFFLLLI